MLHKMHGHGTVPTDILALLVSATRQTFVTLPKPLNTAKCLVAHKRAKIEFWECHPSRCRLKLEVAQRSRPVARSNKRVHNGHMYAARRAQSATGSQRVFDWVPKTDDRRIEDAARVVVGQCDASVTRSRCQNYKVRARVRVVKFQDSWVRQISEN